MTSNMVIMKYPPEGFPVPSEADEFSYPRELSWKTVKAFLDQQSFRRIFFFAGGAGVCFAAFYLYRSLSVRKNEGDSVVAVSTVHIPVDETLRYPYKENVSSKSYAESPNKKLTAPRPRLEDKVVIHCCPRGFYVPSIATEPLKLETFLRVANIPYEVNFCNEFETPFLTYGDKVGNDFRECIRLLSEHFVVDLETKDVSSSRKTAARLVDVSLENHFAWAILIWRWIFDEGKSLKKIHAMNTLGVEVVPEVSMRVKEATKYHPIGQMGRVEFVKTINEGITDIAAALGRHKYIQGQTPGIVDCHAFAILAQVLWNMPGSPFENELKKFGNLIDFVKRMKEKFWPDWNELILKPQEFEEHYNNYCLSIPGRNIRSSSANSKSRHISRNQERGETADKKNDRQDIQGASDEESSQEKKEDENLEERSVTNDIGKNKLLNSEVVTVPTLEANEDSQVLNVTSQNDENREENQGSQEPTEILKPGGTGTTTPTASVGSTPVDQVHQPAEPVRMNHTGPSPRSSSPHPVPPQQQSQQQEYQLQYQQQTHPQEYMFQEPKPSVRFDNSPSSESPVVNHQTEQRSLPPQSQQYYNNGNFQPSITHPQVGMRAQMYPASAAELTMRNPAVERQQAEQARHSMIPQGHLGSYAVFQRHQLQNNSAVNDYQRANTQNSIPSQQQQSQYFLPPQPPTQTTLPSYTQPQHPSYPLSPQIFANQQSRSNATSYTQQQMLHYTSTPPMGISNAELAQRQPATYSNSQQQPFNSEQIQKAAQAHLDAYIQQQQRQRNLEQHNQPYTPSQNINYHSRTANVPNFVAPQYDPRNPSSALFRF